MRAPQYIVNNPEISKYSKYTMNLHLSKLQVIKERKGKLMLSTPPPIGKYSKLVDESRSYLGKKNEIDRENKLLYRRLFFISNNSSAMLERVKGTNRVSFKSSYQIFRQNQDRKIAVENAQLVKKLTEAKPALIKKTLDEEYAEYKKRKKRLLKISTFDGIKAGDGARSLSPLKTFNN